MIMSIASEIERLQNAKSALKTAIEGKGVSVPAATKLDGYSALVDSIEQGGAAIDLESIARGMLDFVTQFELPAGFEVNPMEYALANRKCVGEVKIMSGRTAIKMYALFNCTASSVIIPSSVGSVSKYALHTRYLEEIVVEATTPPTLASASLPQLNDTKLTSIYVPDASVEAYKAASGWSTFASIIKPISERPVGGWGSD